MNYLKNTKTYVLLSIVASLGYLLISCNPEEVVPTDVPPVAGFTFTVDNNKHVPANVVITNTTKNGESYLWDFGNGFTSTDINPAIRYQEKGHYVISLIASNAYGSDTASAEIDISGIIVNMEDIQGKWSIVREDYIVNTDTFRVAQGINDESLEFKADGTYQRISSVWVEWESGTYSIVGDTLNLHPLDGSEDFEDQSFPFLSVSENYIKVLVDMVEAGDTITILPLLMRNNETRITIDHQNLLGKWSVTAFDELRYPLISDLVGYRGDETWVDVGLPSPTHNYFTIDFQADDSLLVIDNWQEGFGFKIGDRYLDDEAYWLTTNDTEVLLQVANVTDNDNIRLKVVRFDSENDTTYRYISYYTITRNDGTEASITAANLAGEWEVISKAEKKNNISLPSAEQHGPEVGASVIFSTSTTINNYETGTVTPWENGLSADWVKLDASNLLITELVSGDYRLYHVDNYFDANGELTLYSLWIDGNRDRYEMTLSLLKK